MATPTHSKPAVRRYLPLIAIALLYPAYLGVTAAIRARVNQHIERRRGEPLPEFSLADRAGNTVSRASLLGKPVVLHFFRSHCVSCEREKPEVRAFVASLDLAKVSFLSVMTDRVEGYPPETSEATLERSGFTWPVLMADDAFVDAFHGADWAHVTPITYFVDAKGTIVTTLRGEQTQETLRAALDQTLGAGGNG